MCVCVCVNRSVSQLTSWSPLIDSVPSIRLSLSLSLCQLACYNRGITNMMQGRDKWCVGVCVSLTHEAVLPAMSVVTL